MRNFAIMDIIKDYSYCRIHDRTINLSLRKFGMNIKRFRTEMQTTANSAKTTFVEKSLFVEEIQIAYAHVSVFSDVTGIMLLLSSSI